MFTHPSVHLEIARWRYRDRLAEAELHRLAKLATDGQRSDRARTSLGRGGAIGTSTRRLAVDDSSNEGSAA